MKNEPLIIISDGKGWDEYVRGHPNSLFYHLDGWGKALNEVFAFKKLYLEARQDGKICGILPLILVSTIFGKKLVSIPIGVCAGALGDSEEIRNQLIEKATEFTREFNCDYLELRNTKKSGIGLPSKNLYSTFIKELPEDPAGCLSGMPRKARAAARHAIDSGLSFDVGLGYIDACYEIYATNQRYLGSPVFQKGWFKKLAEVFKNETEVLVVRQGQKNIAAVLTFFYKDTVMPFYGGCLPGYLKLNPNDYMYLKLQEYGVLRGFKYFDFGRSRAGSGSYHFKVNMGFEPAELSYEYYLNKTKNIPNISPSNKSFRLLQNTWRHMPLSFTKWLGPKIFKFVIP